ncbi:hypothetical protein RRG08_019777 [Elysia crispata]|uniref:Uncharacterized protein n=1 Tax=Elysia crispata TaxID=231223 RepID=A0AAE1AY43_9GAST|nr:hypothetical protein RRG08_019777 [Elysia crispata]
MNYSSSYHFTASYHGLTTQFPPPEIIYNLFPHMFPIVARLVVESGDLLANTFALCLAGEFFLFESRDLAMDVLEVKLYILITDTFLFASPPSIMRMRHQPDGQAEGNGGA